MTISLVERKHPRWTIERLQEYLHRNQDDAEANEELSQIEEMGDEARGAFSECLSPCFCVLSSTSTI